MRSTDYQPDYTYSFKSLYPRDADDELQPMYSYDTPSANFWHGVAFYLHKQGKADDEINEILASKDARWMMDQHSDEITRLGESIAGQYFGSRDAT